MAMKSIYRCKKMVWYTNTTNVVYVTYNKGEKTEFTSFCESLRATKDVIEQNIRENR